MNNCSNPLARQIESCWNIRVLSKAMADVFAQGSVLFCNEFEILFEITCNGTLRANWDRLQKIEEFVKRNEFFMKLMTSDVGVLVFNHFHFDKLYKGDIGTINDNKIKLLQVYSVCFFAYVRCCCTLQRPLSRTFHLFTKLDEIELVVDLENVGE